MSLMREGWLAAVALPLEKLTGTEHPEGLGERRTGSLAVLPRDSLHRLIVLRGRAPL